MCLSLTQATLLVNPAVQYAAVHQFLLCTALQFILGMAGFLWPKFSQSSREVLAPYHVFLGRATFIVGLATMAVSISSPHPTAKIRDPSHVVPSMRSCTCIVTWR